MSYTVLVRPAAKADVLAAFDAARVHNTEPDTPEVSAQLVAVRRALAELIDVVGGADAVLQVEVSGHVNTQPVVTEVQVPVPVLDADGNPTVNEDGDPIVSLRTETVEQPSEADEVVYMTVRTTRA